MANSYNVAVVGATTSAGAVVIELLGGRDFPIDNLYLLDDDELAGGRVEFNGSYQTIKDVAGFDFSLAQIALFVGGDTIAAKFVPKASKDGCVVIDSSSQFRMDSDVPLVVPEVNPEAIAGYKARNIIASPGSAAIAMLVALKPIYDAVGIEKINISTYHAVSEMGESGTEELASQTTGLLNMREPECGQFPEQIAFNVIPQVGAILENGHTLEELRLVGEGQKVFDDKSILINPTAVWVPVFFSHSESLHIETKTGLSASAARELLQRSEGIHVIDAPSTLDYPTPVGRGVGTDSVFVGRIREGVGSGNSLNLWVVSDNVRKGSALNCVQIAENLIKNHLER